jgi:D-xylose transport system substrate-binding protein
MAKKLWLALNLVLVAAFMLSACAQPTAAPTAVPAQPTAAPAQPTAAPAQPTSAPAAGGKVTVGLSFSDFATERWKNEKDLMSKLLTDKGYNVVWQEANHDVKLQNDQIDNMVTQGAKALIVIAEDGDAAATAVDKAAAAGVKVIAYDRLIKSPNIAAYISFNNTDVGRNEAQGVVKALGMDSGKWTKDNPAKVMLMGGSPTDNNAILVRAGQEEVIKPYVDAGTMKVVADQWVDNWDAKNALSIMENVLTAQNNKIDAVIASNDGTALGALQALKAQGLAGKVPISGQDATADGCNSIVKGEQTVTVFKDIRLLSPLAVDLADKFLKGQTDPNLKQYTMAELTNDKTKTGNVMAYFLPVVQVTKDNVYDVVVKSGFQSYDDVYRDIPDAQRPPKP